MRSGSAGWRLGASVVLLCAGGTLPSTAGEQRSWYAGIEGGVSWTSVSDPVTAVSLCGIIDIGSPCPTVGMNFSESSDGFSATAAVGKKFGSMLRLEAELGYRSTDMSLTDIAQTTAMLNGLVDVALSESITLSVGGGVGADFVSWETATAGLDEDDTVLALQGIAGISLALTDNLAVTLDYRYLTAPDIEMPGVALRYDATHVVAITVEELNTQSVSIGLRFAL